MKDERLYQRKGMRAWPSIKISLNIRDKSKMKTGLNLVFPYSSALRRSYLFVDMMTPVGSVTELGLRTCHR